VRLTTDDMPQRTEFGPPWLRHVRLFHVSQIKGEARKSLKSPQNWNMSHRNKGCRSASFKSYVGIHSFEGLQFGFRFSAKAFNPSSAFSPSFKPCPYCSIVNCVARSTLPVSQASFNAALVTIAESGEIAAISFASFSASSTTVSCDGDHKIQLFRSLCGYGTAS
jgi:hypothetical protein